MNYTTDMAAYSLGLAKRTIAGLCKDGKLDAFKDNKGWLIPESEIVMYRKKQKIPKVEFWKAVERVRARLYNAGTMSLEDYLHVND